MKRTDRKLIATGRRLAHSTGDPVVIDLMSQFADAVTNPPKQPLMQIGDIVNHQDEAVEIVFFGAMGITVRLPDDRLKTVQRTELRFI